MAAGLDVEWYGHKFEERLPTEFKRQIQEGKTHRFVSRYGKWLFMVSTYKGGETIWHAFYRIPPLRERPHAWGGGPEPVELEPGADLARYYKLLKEMADKNPDPWSGGRVWPMPSAARCRGY